MSSAAIGVEKIRQALIARLTPQSLEIRDDSARMPVTPVRVEGGHFSVTVVSDRFAGCTRMQRHQLVYEAVSELLRTDIHALSIQARTPQEQTRSTI